MNLKALMILCAASLIAGAAAAAPPAATSAPPSAADWRAPDPQNVLVIDTNKGRVIVELVPEAAPLTTARLRDLTRAGAYDGRSFFRVIDDFMDQTGDPLDNGTGGSKLPDVVGEFTFRRGDQTPLVVVRQSSGVEAGFVASLPVIGQTLDLGLLTADHKVNAWGTFCPGVAGMARAGDPDSGNSQFFLMRGAHASLDQKYTPFGRVISGMDVVRAIKTGEPPDPPQDRMQTVRVLADIPAAQRPTVRVIDTRSPWFQAMAAGVVAAKGADFSLCDLDLPSQVK